LKLVSTSLVLTGGKLCKEEPQSSGQDQNLASDRLNVQDNCDSAFFERQCVGVDNSTFLRRKRNIARFSSSNFCLVFYCWKQYIKQILLSPTRLKYFCHIYVSYFSSIFIKHGQIIHFENFFVIHLVSLANTNMVFSPCFAYQNKALFSFTIPNQNKYCFCNKISIFVGF
jgi:hypothetical protein